MPLREPKYKHNVAVVKDYGGTVIRFSHHRTLRTKDIVCDDDPPPEKGSVNDEKLDNNLSRAKSMLYEYAYCNPWDYFVTLTIDPAKYDRHDLERIHRDLGHWIRNYNQKHGTALKYLFIPEQHKDGAWHEHGFIFGLPLAHLIPYTFADQPLPLYILKCLAKGQEVYHWQPYEKKFGYCILEPVRNQEHAAKYVTKYITKDMSRCVTELNAHMYYCSKGLKRAEILKQGVIFERFNDIASVAYENEYVRVAWLPHDKDTLKHLNKAVWSERELRKEGAGAHDLAIGNRGIPHRAAGSWKFTKDCPILQAGTRTLCRIYRANPYSRLDPSAVQDVLCPFDEHGNFLYDDADIYPCFEGIPDLVLQ